MKGGTQKVTVCFDNGTEEQIEVRQIKLRQYDEALAALDSEIRLAAISTGLPLEKVEDINPESFEAVSAAVREVNAKGFFSFAERTHERMVKRLSGVNPELLKMAAEKASTSSPHVLQPRRG